jgi:hypothetical protein
MNAKRILLTLGIAAIVILAVVAGVFYVPEMRYWSKHRDIELLSRAQYINRQLESFRKDPSVLPEKLDDAGDFADDLSKLMESSNKLRHPIENFRLNYPLNAETPEELLVGTDRLDRKLMVFYRDGTVGIDRNLLTRKAADLPSWVVVLEPSDR